MPLQDGNLGNLSAFARLNTSMLRRDYAVARVQIRSFGRGLQGALGMFTLAGLTGSMLNAAVQAEKVEKKFDILFGKISNLAGRTARDFADAFDLADVSAKDLLSRVGDMLIGFKMSRIQTLKLSDSVSRLAQELVFSNPRIQNTQQAVDALVSAMLGNVRAARRLSVSFRKKMVTDRLAAKGLGHLRGNQLKAAEAEETFRIALEQSAHMLGLYKKSQDTMAVKLHQTSQAWKQLKVNVGNFLIKALDLPKVLKSISDWMNKIGDRENILSIKIWATRVQFAFKRIFLVAQLTIGNVWAIFKNLGENISKSVKWISDNWKVIWENLGKSFDIFEEHFNKKWKVWVDALWDTFAGKADEPINFGKAKQFEKSLTMKLREAGINITDSPKFKKLTKGVLTIKAFNKKLDALSADEQKAMDAIFKKEWDKLRKPIEDFKNMQKDAAPPEKEEDSRMQFAEAFVKGTADTYARIFKQSKPQKDVAKSAGRTADNTDQLVEQMGSLIQRVEEKPKIVKIGN